MRSRFFDKEDMIGFYQTLSENNDLVTDVRFVLDEKILVMTHDDYYDEEMHEFALERNADCTFFCLASKAKQNNNGADIQFHWNKGSHYSLQEQLMKFQDKVGEAPIANRNHRLYWRESHLDLACLAMNNIKHDSSLMGQGSYLPVVQSRLLPIIETPLSITDWPYVDVTKNAHCTYTLVSNPTRLFEKEITPIIALFHPYLKEQTKWRELYKIAEDHGYRVTSIRKYHELITSQEEMPDSLSW